MGSHDAAHSATQTATAATRSPARAAAAPAQPQQVLQGPGEPLHAGLRAHFGRRFGCDFGRVRVHADAAAAASARALDAQAYTVGRHIVFGQSEYAGDGRANLPLLAHELAHVVQQDAQPYDPRRPLGLQAGDSRDETEAHAAARLATGSAALQARRGMAGAQRLQRAEHGTYVSTLSETGNRVYLDSGEKFYKTWGFPNVKKVTTTEDILDDLAKAKGTIERFRIVSHGSPRGLELGLLKEISSDYFVATTNINAPTAADYTGKGGFRTLFGEMEIINEPTARAAWKAAWDDANANALLVTLGGSKTLPGKDTDLGIVFRALVEERYLADVRTAADTAPQFKNSAGMNSFVNRRRDEYSALLIAAKSDKAGKDAAKKALAGLRSKLKTLLNSITINFGTLEDADAQDMAKQFGDKGVLDPKLGRAIGEGTGNGAFLQKLAKARAKIDTSTHIEIRGCNVGDKPATLDAIRNFFGTGKAVPSISAPDLYQYFYTLNAKSYSAGQQQELEDTFDDSAVGVGFGYTELRRLTANQVVRTAAAGRLTELATRYGFNALTALKLTPEIADPANVALGTAIWLVQRTVAPLGRYKDLKEFATGYLGNAGAEAKLAAANPALKDASNLHPKAQVTVPKDLQAATAVDTNANLKSAFAADVRAGKAPVGLADELDRWTNVRGRMVKRREVFGEPRPVVHVYDAQRAGALGDWLAAQQYDAKGGAGTELAKRFGKTDAAFDRGQLGTFVQFLSHSYPVPVDPIFPQDPRYSKHIIRRP